MPSHPPSIEIKQQARRFVPSVAVVPVGARVLFPNQDTVFHCSVFSNTPGDAFDVGPLKAGQCAAAHRAAEARARRGLSVQHPLEG